MFESERLDVRDSACMSRLAHLIVGGSASPSGIACLCAYVLLWALRLAWLACLSRLVRLGLRVSAEAVPKASS